MIHRFLRIAALTLLAATGLTAVAAPCPTTTIAPATVLPGAVVGANYTQGFTAANSNALPFGFAITSGLPAGSGLAMSSTGSSSANLTGAATQVGNFLVTVTATDTSGCSGGRTYALAISQGSQTISYTSSAPVGATFSGTPYNVTATASSGLGVAFSIDASASSVCSIAGSTVSFIGVGTCVINANQSGNANYSAAPQVQQSFAVGQANQTIAYTSTAPASATVAGATYSVTATATSGLGVAFSIDASATAVCSIAGSTVSFLSVGTCVINANQAGNATYNAAPQVQQSFLVGKANQTISFTSTAPAAATIGGATYNVSATATSGLAVTFTIDASAAAVCSIAGSTVSFLAAGTCVIDANQAGNANYNAALQVQQSFLVNKASQSITYTSTAPAAAVVGGPDYSVTATATSGLPVTFTIDASAAGVCSISGSTISFIGAGTCIIDANQPGDAAYNAAPQAQQTFAVAKGSQTISFTSTAPTNAYASGPTYAVTATATSGLTVAFTIDASASSVCSIAGSTVSFLTGGTCVINANQAGDANWNAAPQVQQSITVSSCINLAVGQVVVNTMPGGANFCVVNSDATAAEYTYLPINTSTTTDATLSVTGTGIQAVTGPPTPRPADAGLPLAPLKDESLNVHAIEAPAAFPPTHVYSESDLVHPSGGIVPLTVGQLIDINTSVGACGIPTDVRKGRVEAITTPQSVGQQVLYMVQEVVEQPAGSGTWVPAVAAGAFTAVDFQNIGDSFVQSPPGSTPGASFGTFPTLLKTGAIDVATTNFGTLTDVDNNGGVIVFYTKKMNELSPPASSFIASGLFQSRDLFAAASCGGSNQGELLYMLLPDPTGAVNSNVRTQSFVYGNAGPTLVHHFEHLLNAARRLYFNGAAPLEQTWLDEGLAWELQELVFFNVSVGITPRINVQLSTLTTGPSASIRVADFNTYENPMFGNLRAYFYQLPGSNASRRAGPLRQTPYGVGSTPTVHEVTASNFTTTYAFIRYALDRKNTGDAALLSSLVNTNLVGVANLQAMIGVDPNLWARDFLVAMYLDDAGVAGVSPEYTHPSWNFRSVYGGLGGFPLTVNPLTDGTPLTFVLGVGGGTRYTRFGVAPAGSGTLVMTEGGVSPTSPISTAVMRTK